MVKFDNKHFFSIGLTEVLTPSDSKTNTQKQSPSNRSLVAHEHLQPVRVEHIDGSQVVCNPHPRGEHGDAQQGSIDYPNHHAILSIDQSLVDIQLNAKAKMNVQIAAGIKGRGSHVQEPASSTQQSVSQNNDEHNIIIINKFNDAQFQSPELMGVGVENCAVINVHSAANNLGISPESIKYRGNHQFFEGSSQKRLADYFGEMTSMNMSSGNKTTRR